MNIICIKLYKVPLYGPKKIATLTLFIIEESYFQTNRFLKQPNEDWANENLSEYFFECTRKAYIFIHSKGEWASERERKEDIHRRAYGQDEEREEKKIEEEYDVKENR